MKEPWCIPPKASAAFVCVMENALTVYQRPLDPAYPGVCMDETSKQLVKETRLPLAMKPGQIERYDYEYERNATANLFMLFAPFLGWRCVTVTDRRTKQDWAQVIKDLVDVHFSEAKRITIIQDNLNTHKAEALYETFEPIEARRILDKLDFVYTPKHGSWLNMAEIEFSSLAKQCLDRPMPDKPFLETHITAWASQRNSLGACTHWWFTTHDARVKLAKLYPSI